MRNDILRQAKDLRAQIDTAAGEATDATASKCVGLYQEMQYTGELIAAGTRIQWNDGLKRAAVDLWDTEENNPDNAPTLWSDMAYKDGYRVIPDPITADAAFSAGEIGYWPGDGKFYRAKNNGTVWTPEQYAEAWEVVGVY